VLRLLVLKHLYDWSFDECEREVRGHLVYRAFCRIDGERVPDAKTLIRLAHLLDEAVLKDVLARLVALGRAQHLIRGRRLRVDTTVVETNSHYPTDSTRLADGVRVLTRTLRRLGAPVRARTRSVARCVFEIAQRSRTTGARASQRVRERTKARMKILYQGLMRITRAVVRAAEAAVTQLPPRPRRRGRRLAERLHATLGVIRRSSRWLTAALPRGRTSAPPRPVACGTSCCRGSPGPGAPGPPAPRCAGAPAARGVSARSSGVMGCGGAGIEGPRACSDGSGSG